MDFEHERRLTEVEARSKSNAHRIDEVEKKQADLAELVVTVKALAVKEERVESDVKEIKTDVKTLTGKPGQRWENFVTQIVSILAAAVIGYVLAKFGLGG